MADTHETVYHAGDEWRVLSTGAERAGETYCHLASLTQSRQQRNGMSPLQIGDWIANEKLRPAKP